MPYLSVVTPVYNAVNIVDELYRQLVENLEKITDDFEIIMVNDACPYGSGEKIMALAEKDSRVKFVDFTRNFGQHIAIAAGIDVAEGDYVAVMDCDLQDPPDKIQQLLEKLIQDKAEICFAVRENRKDNKRKIFYSKLFKQICKLFYKKELYVEQDICNFTVITRQVVLKLRQLREINRCYPLMLLLVGFPRTFTTIEFNARFEGHSAYTFLKALKLAFNAMMIQSSVLVVLNSAALLFSSLFCFLSLLGLGYTYAYNGVNDYGFGTALILFCISLFFVLLFGVQHFIVLYITGTYQEVLHRPLYFVKRTKNIKEI